jgi:hypothetical protein
MKQIIIYILILYNSLLFVECSNKTDKIDKTDLKQKFVEDNFLTIVDTLAYSRGAFITLPSDTIRYSKLSVKLSQKIAYNSRVNEFVLAFFEKNDELKKIFKDILVNNENHEILLDSNFPKKIGKYHIFFNNNERDRSIKYAGTIGITNLKIDKDKAMLVLSESVEHFGKTYIVLLIKEKNDWEVVKRELLWQS